MRASWTSEVEPLSVHDQDRMPTGAGAEHLLNSPYVIVRTVVDPVLAVLLIIICAPILAAIAVVIRLDSQGPALFRQRRIGKDGKPFTLIKFRTMRVEAPTYSLKVADDNPIITGLGAFLRQSGLDELPQLWNVLRGDMAIIGPRPEQIQLHALYEPWQRQRELIRPGITGWWQIHHRDGQPLHLNVDKDLYYIEHQGPWLDGLIVVGTCRIMLAGFSAKLRTHRRRTSRVPLVEVVAQEVETPQQLSPEVV